MSINQNQKIFKVIQDITGVFLTDEKIYLLEHRLTDLMKEYNLKTYNEVADKILSMNDSKFNNQVIDLVTTHETKFFREVSIFDAFTAQIIPEWLNFHKLDLIKIKASSKKLNIWCAACSTGQEPYSLAILIKEKMPALFNNISILATDISEASIKKAIHGSYNEFEMSRGMPEHLKSRYFKQDGLSFQINDEMKSIIEFKTHNLLDSTYPNQFDIILCRNVVIYFNQDLKKEVYNKLRNSLNSYGTLILGSAESLSGYVDGYILREFGLARYFEFSNMVTFF